MHPIVHPWKDQVLPVGEIELTDEQLAGVSGAGFGAGYMPYGECQPCLAPPPCCYAMPVCQEENFFLKKHVKIVFESDEVIKKGEEGYGGGWGY